MSYKSDEDIHKAINSKKPQNLVYLLDGSDYDKGVIEELRSSLELTQLLVCKLSLLLLSKGVLSTKELETAFDQYDRGKNDE